MIVWGWVGGALAGCPRGMPVEIWSDYLDTAEAAYAELDAGAFRMALSEAERQVPCLTTPLSPSDAARFHLLHGVDMFGRGAREEARLSFASARAADPGLEVPEALLAPGHAARALFSGASTPGVVSVVPAPVAGSLRFDGHPGLDWPQDRPSLAQVLSTGGEVTASAYLVVGDALLPYEAALPPSARRSRTVAWGLLGTGSAASLSSVVLLGVASHSAARFAGPQPPEAQLDDLRSLQARTNREAVASGILGGVGAAALLGALVTW